MEPLQESERAKLTPSGHSVQGRYMNDDVKGEREYLCWIEVMDTNSALQCEWWTSVG